MVFKVLTSNELRSQIKSNGHRMSPFSKLNLYQILQRKVDKFILKFFKICILIIYFFLNFMKNADYCIDSHSKFKQQ